MDPNETLKELRQIVNDKQRIVVDDYIRMRELFQALDQWLTRGGFPPGDWIKVHNLRKRKDEICRDSIPSNPETP